MKTLTASRNHLAILPISFLAIVALSIVPVTHAYGNTALWQIAISQNCDNPSLCGSNLGGFWAWAEFDTVGGDATLTFCAHAIGGIAPGGAGHINVDILSWTVASGSAGPLTFFVTGETDTLVGHGPPVSVTVSPEFFDTGIPAAPGHYSSLTLFGVQAPPGTNFEIQVVQLN